MKRFLITVCLAVMLMLGGAGGALAAHYIDGMEPTPDYVDLNGGFTLRMYNSFYNADNVKDNDGNSIGDMDLSKYMMTLRGYYMTSWDLLGARYGFSLGVPIGYNRLSVGNFSDDNFNFGDMYFEPIILKWSGYSYDIVASAGVYIPTGDFKASEATSVGSGYWGGLVSLGGNYYITDAKDWFISAGVKYEINSEARDTNWQPGDLFHTEYSINKRFDLSEKDRLTVGIGGYTKVQVTDDSGLSPLYKPHGEFVTAIGPILSYNLYDWGTTIGFKGFFEMGAKNQPEGMNFMLTLTQKF
jgi:hypothetical protein